ncbi:(E)-4-hydroxy-3-methylbut-2-enyl-diphosphate synthase [Pedobacter paludis]|uniref:4-hydroxy-3-methylbut-2-en-1-yl diphosphate synthase (flavodoxin) n=1 Tax=Pedobacter paludis TaxID=2203212 RepID=A0A317EV69_9SPHI|nr:(E)-4-hydroxy-3-methylbut-2-enyl-diphosphate synthase [Pedobacter paludis]PWS29833.1 4-hydroxy-3-methylbut-2-en-1-yl diphosphate synthase [Pedobacter paludis]
MENLSVKHDLEGGYCNSLTQYSRFLTREVKIGDIAMGAHNPIRIQSMTTTDTMNTLATVEQTIRMVESGSEYVRITAPSIKEAENLANIKKELRYLGYDVPLIADIHFTPNAAEMAARIVEKVRVNPGNYADKKKFENIEYTQDTYDAELARIYKKFIPLVKICKEYGTAMRIGTNHGSLSDRIMSHYGDTPRGMVESAMEFIRMCEDQNYYNLVISMKASNTQVMVQAYRLLVETMTKEGMNYPLHLGVTEAGDGEDGRIKSAVGIGTLLEDGLGDTIRVSLTEDPEFEAPVAKALADRYPKRVERQKLKAESHKIDGTSSIFHATSSIKTYSPYSYSRRISESVQHIGGHHHPVVMIDVSKENLKDPYFLNSVGYNYSAGLDKYNLADQACDLVYLGDNLPSFSFPGNLKQIYNYQTWLGLKDKNNCHPLFSLEEFNKTGVKDESINFVEIDSTQLNNLIINQLNNVVLILKTSALHGMAEQRAFFVALQQQNIQVPVIIKRTYSDLDADHLMLYSATDLGALFTDGFGDGIWIDAPGQNLALINSTSFGILQATRTRISKTEYISCPSCGRTLFDLQETTQLIRSRTDHLKGLKIGIMGCIVNGPGEMADADYGYVGTGPDKITLYRGQEVVKKNVNTAFALDELIDIIKGDGNWVEKV